MDSEHASPTDVSAIDLPRPESFYTQEIEKQWQLITEAIRRALPVSPAVRKVLVAFSTSEVTEELPAYVLTALATQDRTLASLIGRYEKTLMQYLLLPTTSKTDLRDNLTSASWQKDRPELRNNIVKRYAFARDLKLLALGAELQENQSTPNSRSGENKVSLPSGIVVGLQTSDEFERSDMLKPHLWEKRRQLKDRVYEITVNGRKYILKERKTEVHTDIKKHGHVDGLTSEGEFLVGKYFSEQPRLQQGILSLHWERPLGYVQYPDGFQFTVFEHEEGLIPQADIYTALAQKIEEHADEFQAEYNKILQLLPKFLHDPRLPLGNSLVSELVNIAKSKLGFNPAKDLMFSFKEYAFVKSFFLVMQAPFLLFKQHLQHDYDNNDIDGYAFRIREEDKLGLEVVAFDYEYFRQMPADFGIDRRRSLEKMRKERLVEMLPQLLPFVNTPPRRAEYAAYLALLDNEPEMVFEK